MKKSQMKNMLKELEGVCSEAGKILMRYKKKRASINVKGKASQGVASEADMASEKYISKKLKSISKKYGLLDVQTLAEEEAYLKFGSKKAYKNYQKIDYCWSVDPLDGTNNFLTGLDYYAISLGLLHQDEVLVGVIFRPETDECFSAIRGEGAFKKKLYDAVGRKKRLGKDLDMKFKPAPKRLADAVFATGFASEKGESFDREFEIFKRVMDHSRAVRRMGSAALDLCYVAQGIFDGFWERGLAPWDTSAASLICEEAGVKVTDYEGRSFSSYGKSVLVARPALYPGFKKIVHPSQ